MGSEMCIRDRVCLVQMGTSAYRALPQRVANTEVLREQILSLTPNTAYEVEYDTASDFSSDKNASVTFRTQLEDLRNKLGAVRVNGNTLVGWDTSADLEFDTSVSFPTPSFAHPVTVEAGTADPGATLVIDNASQTGEDKDVLTFRITVTFGSLPVRVYTLRVTIDAPFSFNVNTAPNTPCLLYTSPSPRDS